MLIILLCRFFLKMKMKMFKYLFMCIKHFSNCLSLLDHKEVVKKKKKLIKMNTNRKKKTTKGIYYDIFKV